MGSHKKNKQFNVIVVSSLLGASLLFIIGLFSEKPENFAQFASLSAGAAATLFFLFAAILAVWCEIHTCDILDNTLTKQIQSWQAWSQKLTLSGLICAVIFVGTRLVSINPGISGVLIGIFAFLLLQIIADNKQIKQAEEEKDDEEIAEDEIAEQKIADTHLRIKKQTIEKPEEQGRKEEKAQELKPEPEIPEQKTQPEPELKSTEQEPQEQELEISEQKASEAEVETVQQESKTSEQKISELEQKQESEDQEQQKTEQKEQVEEKEPMPDLSEKTQSEKIEKESAKENDIKEKETMPVEPDIIDDKQKVIELLEKTMEAKPRIKDLLLRQFKFRERVLPNGTKVVIIKILGAISEKSVREFEKELEHFIQTGSKTLILDFVEVKYINSTGLGVLIKALDQIKEAGLNILFADLPEKAQDLFDMINVSPLLKIHDSVEEAILTLSPREKKRFRIVPEE